MILRSIETGLVEAPAGVGLAALILILFELLHRGLGALSLDTFIHPTPGPGSTGGGLLNAIVGSLAMTIIAIPTTENPQRIHT